MIVLNDISKTFHAGEKEVHALKEVSIHVERGDIYGIIGFSGAGKSTLLRMVNQLEKPDYGTVIVDGQQLSALSNLKLRQARRKIGMIFQQFNLLESKTVAQNVGIALVLAGLKKEEIHARVREVLRFVELEDKENVYVSRLSGGQKQRVGIARALATSPDILLCDEATSALDPKTTESILALLKRINREMGVTILLITHQMQVIQRICSKVAVMEDGRVLEQGTVLNVFGNPRKAVTQEFVRTVISDQIPESIRSLTLEETRNQKIERLKFIGDCVKKPVIAEICAVQGLTVNILCATVQEMQDTVMCVYVLQLIGPEEVILQAERLIDEHDVLRERMALL